MDRQPEANISFDRRRHRGNLALMSPRAGGCAATSPTTQRRARRGNEGARAIGDRAAGLRYDERSRSGSYGSAAQVAALTETRAAVRGLRMRARGRSRRRGSLEAATRQKSKRGRDEAASTYTPQEKGKVGEWARGSRRRRVEPGNAPRPDYSRL